MTEWSLQEIFRGLDERIELQLSEARRVLAHPSTTGEASEQVWLDLFKKYLPQRYICSRAFIADSLGNFSDQLDAVIYDRQYSPLFFEYGGATVIPIESVYAVFEAKQKIDKPNLEYAQKKVASVRNLQSKTLPIPQIDGSRNKKTEHKILGGFLALESGWNSKNIETNLVSQLNGVSADKRLNIGCIAAHATFLDTDTSPMAVYLGESAAAFLFKLVSELQALATVPMINLGAYGQWLPHNSTD